jgi:regulation of enolase protein 1 (concanavalin A-like superfamily)
MNRSSPSKWFVPFAAVVALELSSGIARAQQPLPGWFAQADIGDVGVAGSAGETDDNRMFVNGAGSDIWGTADSFHFVYQTLEPSVSDGAIGAVYKSQNAANPFAKVGIMIRMSLDPGSPHVILDVNPDGNIEFMTRSTQGGPTTFVAGFRPSPGGELFLMRENGVVTAYVCEGGPCHTVGSTPFPSGVALYGVAVTNHDPSTLNHGEFQISPFWNPLPLPWFSQDVGDVGLTGDAFESNGVFTVKGAGADIWGTNDAYRRMTQESLGGDGEVVARLTSEDGANPFAKAGLAMTAGNASGVAMVILDVRPNGIIEFMHRTAYQAPMQFIAGSAASFPVWLKLVKHGQQFTGYMSNDGQTWQTVGVLTNPINGYEAGLVVTSHDTGALNTATFDHVNVLNDSFSIDANIGDTGVVGREDSTDTHGGFALQGGGGDIWGTADAFNYWYTGIFDDGARTVQVRSLDNTNPFAKAGLMLRESLDPSAAHVILDVRPDGSIEFMTRSSTGAETTYLAGATASFPVSLRLTRSGLAVTGEVSQDGTTWTTVATTSPTIPSDALIGVAVTSHVKGTNTLATFSSLSYPSGP